ncbi:hypothetical protein ACNKHU_13635 [Shigella flexneri]
MPDVATYQDKMLVFSSTDRRRSKDDQQDTQPRRLQVIC